MENTKTIKRTEKGLFTGLMVENTMGFGVTVANMVKVHLNHHRVFLGKELGKMVQESAGIMILMINDSIYF